MSANGPARGAGLTSWYPSDAAEHDRALNVELGVEFGPAGPLVMRVMKDLAGQQSLMTGGHVLTGFLVLAQKCHIDRDVAVEVVRRAGEIGALDDLQIDADGRRFSCRISGWDADVKRGRETLKKRAQRAATTPDTAPPPTGDVSPSEGDTSPVGGDVSPKCPPTGHNRTGEEEEETRANALIDRTQLDDVLRRLAGVRDLQVEEMAVLSAIRRAERAGADVLDLADATVSQAIDYAAGGTLRASAGQLMHSLLDRRERNAAAQLARKSAEVRTAFEGRGRPRRRSSAEERAAALEAKARDLEAAEAGGRAA